MITYILSLSNDEREKPLFFFVVVLGIKLVQRELPACDGGERERL